MYFKFSLFRGRASVAGGLRPQLSPARPQLSLLQAPFPGAPITSLRPDSMSDSMSDFDPTSTHLIMLDLSSRPPRLRSYLPSLTAWLWRWPC